MRWSRGFRQAWPYPTTLQAELARPDVLVEISVIAVRQ
jgi:enamine deaminase RidA (YjgF/YER057c/UK114 family)